MSADSQPWPAVAARLLGLACAEHGGTENYARIARLGLELRNLSGPLVLAKGLGRTFPAPRRVDVQPHECMTTFHEFPVPGQRGVFERGSVRLEREDGVVLARSAEHRSSFGTFSKYRRWQPLDALYFFGYALWHYHTLPFSLAGATFVHLAEERGMTSISVDLGSIPTHGRRQTFFFDEAHRLVRHDYRAEIIGAWACGSHYWSDYVRCENLLVARKRRVLFGPFGRPLPLTVLSAELEVSGVDLR